MPEERKANEEKIKELQAKLQMIYASLEEISKESAVLDVYISEYSLARKTLKGMEELSGEEEILVPIGGNAYIKASLREKGKVLYHVGAGIYLELSSEEAVKKLDEALSRIEERMSELKERSLSLSKEAEKVRKELGELLKGSSNV